MKERVRYRPFTGDQDSRIRFDAAPLELVLCQVRWPQVSSLQGGLAHLVAPLGELFSDYPLYSAHQEFLFGAEFSGPAPAPGNVLHQWSRADRSAAVTVSSSSVTLSVLRYEDFDAFKTLMHGILACIQEVLKVPLFDRVGIRYVNRIGDPSKVAGIDRLVDPALLGHQALHPTGNEVSLVHAITQSLYKVGDAFLQARTGVIPPGETVDPSIAPLDTPSWVLDIDSSFEEEALFNPETVMRRAEKLADTAYDFFKLVIRDAFVDEFGGKKI